MASDLAKDAAEILGKVEGFERDHHKQLGEFARNNRLYRAIPTKQRRENQSNTFYPEMTIEVEALATAVYEMVFSDASNAHFFQMVGDGSMENKVRAWTSQAVLEKQMELADVETKSLAFLRKLILQGTYPVGIPWRQEFRSFHDGVTNVRKTVFDSWDFAPFDIVNFGFDDSHAELERSDWAYELMHVKPRGAAKMRRLGIWKSGAVDQAIKQGFTRNPYDIMQRQDAGYLDIQGNRGLTAIDYYGTLESRGDEDIYWAVLDRGTGQFLRDPQRNPNQHGEKKWLVAKWISLPDEFYAIGTGSLNFRTQSELNDRRNFINDILYASLYNQWLVRSDSGLHMPGNKMHWKPHEIIHADGISDEFIRALRPDLGALAPAINIEQSDIERMRRVSGATSSLQAIATGVTATESQSITSEATRRVKVMVRSEISTFYRKFVGRAHQLNLQFLDRPLSAKFTGADGIEIFGEASREDLLLRPGIDIKMSTDLDFRPVKRRELIEMLGTFAQLEQNGLLTRRGIIPDPIIEELAQTYNMDPRKFFKREGLIEMETQRATGSPEVQSRALGEVVSESPAAQEFLKSPQADLIAGGAA